MKLKNKVAIITGARRGIGFGVAEEMAKEGATVIISDIDEKECQKSCKILKQKYKIKTLAIKCDVSNQDEVNNLISQTVKKFKRVDILVNNAGVVVQKPFIQTTEKDYDFTLDINLKGMFFCSQAATKQMIKQKKGKIISMTSIAGLVGFGNIAAYSASKGGIIALTRELALDLAKHNINVNAIAPGIIKTNMTAAMLKDKKTKAGLLAQTPLGRVGLPKDIGRATVFLASNDSDFITGQTLAVDGGWLSH